MKTIFQFLCITVLSILFFDGCQKKDSEVKPKAENIHLKFNFSHTIDGAALQLDTIKYLNSAGNQYSIINLRYFISNISLHNGLDSVLINDAHYVDVTDNTTLSYAPSQSILNGTYNRISFVFGLDTVKNVSGHFLNPPESNMAWPDPLGGGYHYMQLEGKYDSATIVKNYDVHTGQLMGKPYYIYINLPQSSFIADGTDVTVNFIMNINEWFKNPNTYNFNTFGDTVMTSATAQQQLHQNGADVFSIGSIQ